MGFFVGENQSKTNTDLVLVTVFLLFSADDMTCHERQPRLPGTDYNITYYFLPCNNPPGVH